MHALTPGTDILIRAATNDGKADVRAAELVFGNADQQGRYASAEPATRRGAFLHVVAGQRR